MDILLILLLLPFGYFAQRAYDPSPGITRSRTEARNLDCVRTSQADAHERFPGLVPAPAARGTLSQVDAVTCSRRIMSYGERPAQDEVILSSLRQSVGTLTQAAAAIAGENVRWHVDAFYPSQPVAAKISVAARMDLAERGHRVSDRVPVLAAGDIAVLGALPPREAYPLACKRYFAEHSLSDGDAFLALMIVDAQETQLHAGLCLAGTWRWLR